VHRSLTRQRISDSLRKEELEIILIRWQRQQLIIRG